ncbi:MAG: DUF6434 domain-containing protein [Anaerolineae bacterium]
MTERPELNSNTLTIDFLDFYWLKNELTDFCREVQLSTSGSKQEITKRIAHFLETGERLKPAPKRKAEASMPETFSRDTVIEDGWRNSQALRAFFEAEIGKAFHFNVFLRDYITNSGVGQTLGEAIDGWHESKNRPKGSSEIGEQFEYNRHLRAFYDANPGAPRAEAIAAWKEKRSKRASQDESQS